MVDEPPPEDAIFHSCCRVSTLLMFGEGAISSSESPAPSGSGVPERGVPEIVFSFLTLWIGERSLLVSCSGFRQPETEAVRGSLVDAALEGGGAYGSKNPAIRN